MICAVYARKSTEQDVSDDAKSVTRQLALARAFADERGWTVAEEYVDDGISGAVASKLVNRARLLAAASEGKFSAVIVRDYDRLSRDDREGPGFIYALEDCGVEIWYYADRSRVDTRTALTRGMLSMKATFAAAEREAAQSRTREALRSKAQRGHVAGGLCYGYKNVRTGDHVEREIIPAEAAIICRIFAEIAQGRGFALIAKGLNADAVPCPRGRCWAMSGVREMVFRDLYQGRVVYGKTTWDYRKGRKFKIAAPESAWIIREDPRLRIVDEDLWKAAHTRLDRTRQTYLRRTGGALWGRPEAGIEARHLLSGFVVCGTCGGAMHAIRRTGRRGRPKIYFTCNNARVNGACGNRLSLTVSELDRVVVETIRKYVLTPEIVEDVITRAIELYASEADVYAERRDRLTAEATRLQDELARFTEAIRLGGPLVSLVAEIKHTEQRRADVLAQLEHLEGLAKAPAWDDSLRDEIRRRLVEWQELIGREPEVARQILRRLLVGRLKLTPHVTDAGRWYQVEGQATYGQLFEGLPCVVGVVPPG